MKTWGELSSLERSTALQRAKILLVDLIIEGVIEVEMPNAVTQRVFNKILTDSRREENPNMGMMMLFANKAIDKELDRISIAAAQGSRYDNNGEAITKEYA